MALRKDKYGSFVVDEMPSEDALNEHYSSHYYDGYHTNFPGKYTEEEINYLHFKDKVLEYFINTRFQSIGKALLDIGCGEGFTLNYFHQRGYSCYGTDFTRQGIAKEHPDLLNDIKFQQTNIITGDYYEGKEFDVIVGNGILEHVTDKEKILRTIHSKLNVGGCLFLVVPNDFSSTHKLYMDINNLEIEECPWYAAPEHLTYFNADSLKKTVESFGFKAIALMTDFPIEMFLLNKKTDFYSTDFGQTAHQIRVSFLNLIGKDIRKAIKVGTSMLDAGVGRDILSVFVRL